MCETFRNILGLLAVQTAFACICDCSRAERPTPRPVRSDAERSEYIAELRTLYAGAPSTWPAPVVDEGVEHRELGPVPEVTHPEENPGTAEKIKLGKMLFFEPRLSGSKQIACASCHDPDLGWADGRATSFGHNRTQLKRNSPAIMNSGFREHLFWDGRADDLEDQAAKVLNNQDEMHSSENIVIENLRDLPGYATRFEAVFGPGGLTYENAVSALSAFERTVTSGTSRFDSFLKGRPNALDDAALSGLHLFRTEARCMNCHNGPLLTDDKFHVLGLSNYGRRFEDLGRYRITEDPADVGAFRTPSLRNVMNTAPYMHSGLFDIDEILRLYNTGMPTPRRRKDQADDPLFPTKSPLLKDLNLNAQDLGDLKAFLTSLSESHRRVEVPELPAFD